MALYDDPRVLRAVAHPTRNRILSELFAVGSLRAADLARELGIPANQASFHLRQLAKYGLVEEAPEEARDKRDRVWRLVDPTGVTFRTKDVEAQPGGKAAVAVFRRQAGAWAHRLVDEAYSEEPLPEGQDRTISEWSVRLTRAEVEEFNQEMGELVARWLARTRDTDAERTTYSVFQLMQPYPALPTDDGS